jgi:muconolactone delta-isomerase
VKILAIFHDQADPAAWVAAERQRVAELREAGVVEQLWPRADRTGAVLLLEAENADDARRHLATLPLVEHGIAWVDVIELLPESPG